jgi:hypothetical protein
MGILFKMLDECNRTGQTPEQVHDKWKAEARQRVKDDPSKKTWGECEVCGDETALVKTVELCGPCCFGESDTAYGNF